MALNLMLWLTMRINIGIVDGGGRVAMSGFPLPWFRSTVMGTGGIDVSILFFLFDFAVYAWVTHLLMTRWGFASAPRDTHVYLLCALCVIALTPVAGALLMAFAWDDWSSLMWLPWSGWDGKAPNISWAHGLPPFTPQR